MFQQDQKTLLEYIETYDLPGFLKEEVKFFISSQSPYKCLRLKAVQNIFEKYLIKLEKKYRKELYKLLNQKRREDNSQTFILNTHNERLDIDYILSTNAQDTLKLSSTQIFDLLDNIENELINLINCYKLIFSLESITFIHGSELRLLEEVKRKRKK